MPDGRSAPCCTWKGFFSEQRGSDFFNGDSLEELRQQMRDHSPPPGCKDCVNSDTLGTYSQRRDGWDVYRGILGLEGFTDQPQLRYMEINLSNICNLRCRMCGNDRSSRWTADSQAMGFHVHGRVENDMVITDDMLRNLRYIRLLGGEPLLHEDQLIDLLSRAAELGTLTLLTLGITTNGMVRPGPQLIELLTKCASIFWTVSVDAVGQLNDYIRSGSSWDVLSQNLLYLDGLSCERTNWQLGIGTVCCVANANRMEELANWVDGNLSSVRQQHHWYPVNFPEYLAVNRLPAHYLSRLADKYDHMAEADSGWRSQRWWRPLAQHMRNSMEREAYMERHPSWQVYAGPTLQLMDSLDQLRGDSFNAVNPSAYQAMREANQ